jgi:hypothetical protein
MSPKAMSKKLEVHVSDRRQADSSRISIPPESTEYVPS